MMSFTSEGETSLWKVFFDDCFDLHFWRVHTQQNESFLDLALLGGQRENSDNIKKQMFFPVKISERVVFYSFSLGFFSDFTKVLQL